MRRGAVTLALVGALVGAFAPVAQAEGVFVIVPSGGNARCVGPEWSKTGAVGILGPWEAHFNSGGVVTHSFAVCDHS
ncbi:MAG: hypothetical protein WD269_09225 [Acidimicrobiia bacterium]